MFKTVLQIFYFVLRFMMKNPKVLHFLRVLPCRFVLALGLNGLVPGIQKCVG